MMTNNPDTKQATIGDTERPDKGDALIPEARIGSDEADKRYADGVRDGKRELEEHLMSWRQDVAELGAAREVADGLRKELAAARSAPSAREQKPKWPPARGVTRMADNSLAVLVSLKYRPTDNQLRAMHEFLRLGCTCEPDEDGFHAANCGASGVPPEVEQKLDRPAWIGNTSFGVGIKWSTVIGRAQREYEYQMTPEKRETRQALHRKFLENFADDAAEIIICTCREQDKPLCRNKNVCVRPEPQADQGNGPGSRNP